MILVVMDYSVGSLFIEEVPHNLTSLEGNIIIREMGFKESEISYMFVRKPVDIHISSEKLTNIIEED